MKGNLKILANNGGDSLFYTVVARFNLRSYGHVANGTFLNLDNANKFAAEQKQEFFDRVQDDSPNYRSAVVLDEEFTIHEENERLFHFYGITDDEENVVDIKVHESIFIDEPQAIITVPEAIS